jgi:hypothetical protein
MHVYMESVYVRQIKKPTRVFTRAKRLHALSEQVLVLHASRMMCHIGTPANAIHSWGHKQWKFDVNMCPVAESNEGS